MHNKCHLGFIDLFILYLSGQLHALEVQTSLNVHSSCSLLQPSSHMQTDGHSGSLVVVVVRTDMAKIIFI